MRNEETPEFKALWLDAIAVQDACNLSGVVHSFSKAMSKLIEIDNANEQLGTGWRNSNAVSRLWADKIRSLTGDTKVSDWTVPEIG